MGSHRKSKATSTHHRKGSSSSPNSSSHLHPDNAHELDSDSFSADYDEYDIDYDDEKYNNQNLDFSRVLQDVEGSLVGTMTSGVNAISQLFSSSPSPVDNNHTFRVTWKELMYLVLAICCLAGISILMGLSAGITISIHYFDAHSNPSFPRLEARERDIGPHQRVTSLDYGIVSSNILQHPLVGTRESRSSSAASELTLGRVITMSKTGQQSVLMVVEETTPLRSGHNETRAEFSESGQTEPRRSSGSDDGDVCLAKFHGKYKPFRHHGPPDSRFQLSPTKVYPTICSDGVTIGYNDWYTLKAAVEEMNVLAAERFMKWNEYYASLDTSGNSPAMAPHLHNNNGDNQHLRSNSPHSEEFLRQYYDEDAVFTVCPGSTLKAPSGPIFVNAENIVIECGDPEAYYLKHGYESIQYQSTSKFFSRGLPPCTFDVGGSHLSFGPHARNILVRGFAFQSAKSSSLVFYHSGAQASFEDCLWVNNAGVRGGNYGAVADLGSISRLNFNRCRVGPNFESLANIEVHVSGLDPKLDSVLSLKK